MIKKQLQIQRNQLFLVFRYPFGTYNVPKGYHNGSGRVTQSIPTQGAQTITPGTGDQRVTAGRYLTGDITVKGDRNLVAGNIKSGVSIFGVSGSYTGEFNSGRSSEAFSGLMDGGTKTLVAEAYGNSNRTATVNAMSISHSYYQSHHVRVWGYNGSWVQIENIEKNNGASSNDSVIVLNKTYSGYSGIKVEVYLNQGGQNWQMDGLCACYFS